MELKGQMIHVPESCSLMFLGSPRVDKLEELMGRGLYLSDIPIHDATRDVILVGEQARAQDGLKKRMDKLKVKQLLFLPLYTVRAVDGSLMRPKQKQKCPENDKTAVWLQPFLICYITSERKLLFFSNHHVI